MRVKVSVVIDKEVYEKSHALGVNVSKACENYLKILNATIEGTNNGNKPFSVEPFQEKRVMVRSPGFEPGSSTWQADVLNQARLRPLNLDYDLFTCFLFLKSITLSGFVQTYWNPDYRSCVASVAVFAALHTYFSASKLIRLIWMLLQTKVYLFWSKTGKPLNFHAHTLKHFEPVN
jgi:hypothetical protein